MALKPYAYQQKIIDEATERYALFCDMGTGKTCMVLHLWKQARPKKSVVFCPGIAIENWGREFEMWTGLTPTLITGTTSKKRVKQILSDDTGVIVLNYEALRNAEVFRHVKAFGSDFTVCDESHKIKNRQSKTFKAICAVSSTSRYRYIMTGTPITNTMEDLWAQFYFLDSGETFGSNFFSFRNRYFINRNAGWQSEKAFPKWEVREEMKPLVQRKLALHSSRIKKEDCLELPELMSPRVDVELSPEQRRVYKELKQDLISWVETQDEKPVVVQNALTKLLKLNEVCSGFLRRDDGTVHVFDKNPRLDALMELIESTQEKVIVFCVFKENYRVIRKELEKRHIKYVELTGEMTMTEKHGNVDAFNSLQDLRVCVANPASAGVAINLKSAPYSIFFSRTHSLVDYAQSRDRNYRAGSIDLHKKITHYHLVSKNTIDEAILEAVMNKKKFAESMIDIRRLLL